MGYKVKQEYRTNDLSHKPGGVTIEVERVDGKRFEYTNVKNPNAYMSVLMRNAYNKRAWIKE